MRGLGKELGVEAMSLYKHVGRRDQLIHWLRRDLFRTIELPESGGSPRRELEGVCWALYRGLRRRNGAAHLLLPEARAVDEVPENGVGRDEPEELPHLRVWERMLVPLGSLIPEPLDRAYALRALYGFVVGQVLVEGTTEIGEDPIPNPRSGGGGGRLEVSRIAEELRTCVPEVRFELGLRTLLEAMEARSGF